MKGHKINIEHESALGSVGISGELHYNIPSHQQKGPKILKLNPEIPTKNKSSNYLNLETWN